VHETRWWSSDDVHRLEPVDVTLPARTLIDAAAVLHQSTLELAVDEALRRGLVAFDTLWQRVEGLSQPGRRGIRSLRGLLARRHPEAALTESVYEHLLVKALRAEGLPSPVLQHVISDEAGRAVARADAAYPRAQIAIEYDSYLHHGARAKYVRDLSRRNDLTALGWRVLHVTAPALRSGAPDLCRALRSLLAHAA
jgi:very-short-patch-repair endonuclease